MAQTKANPLMDFSDAMADAVAKAGAATLLVDARQRYPASGICFSPGFVLTADHVVEREDEIRMLTQDGSELTASLAGRDMGSDLAVLKVERGDLTVGARARYEARVGQLVLALGRPAVDGIQASLGVISAIGGPVRGGRGAMLERYLRSDTIPYPGFSGGPLVDVTGAILGINTSGLWRGGSLTIPASLAWTIGETLAQHGHLKRGYLGVRSQLAAITSAQRSALGREQASGLLLVGVEVNSPAEQGGLLVGDILVGLEGQPVNNPDELPVLLVGSVVGKTVAVEILRGGQPLTLKVIIGERK